MIQQADLTTELLAALLGEWLGDRQKLQSMAVSARQLAKAGVAETVADVCMEVCREH